MSVIWQKHCPGCAQAFDRAGYYRDATRPDGVGRLCRACHRARMQRHWKETYYPIHREGLIAAVRERRQKVSQA